MKQNIHFQEALDLINERVPRCPAAVKTLMESVGGVLADDIVAWVDSPSRDVSLKDGYAVISRDLERAALHRPVQLKLMGFHGAGELTDRILEPGQTLRVMTGASLPGGADAVLSGEYASESGDDVTCVRDAGPGRNVLMRGTDVRVGEPIARKGDRLTPGLVGLIAAAGLDGAKVFDRPRVAVIGTGDEVVAPGQPLPEGGLYASNLFETMAWLKSFGLPVKGTIAPDQIDEIIEVIRSYLPETDAFVTSGGAWGSERDLMIRIVEQLGWEGVFHRVRLGPGKAIGFGLLEGKPFFILPGGPPSHEAALLLLALPGVMAMAGVTQPIFPTVRARLAGPIASRAEWTQVVHVRLEYDGEWVAHPVRDASRLRSMAFKNGLILMAEGESEKPTGELVEAVLLE